MKKVKLISATVIMMGLFVASCSQSSQKHDHDSGNSHDMEEMKGLDGFSVNLEQSKVLWSGTSLGVYTHTGIVDFNEANLEVSDGKIVGGSFVADLTSMVATDENFNPEQGYTKEKLIGHLSSPDFFDVETHPTATFKINSVEGNGATGILTIRGISNEEKVTNIDISEKEGKTEVTGKLVFERKKYDVRWDYPVKDKVLKNEIELEIHLLGS